MSENIAVADINKAVDAERPAKLVLGERDCKILRTIFERSGDKGYALVGPDVKPQDLATLREHRLIDMGTRKEVLIWSDAQATENLIPHEICLRVSGRAQNLMQKAWPEWFHKVVMAMTKAQIAKGQQGVSSKYGQSTGKELAEEMTAFDQLPARVRSAIRASIIPLNARVALAGLAEGGDEDELLAYIASLQPRKN